MKKRILVTLLAAAMGLGLLAGCGETGDTSGNAADGAQGSSTEGGASNNSSGEAEEITWMFWDDLNATEDLISLGYADVIERFNKDYEGVYHVTPITTNLEEYYTKLNALVASGETPDVFIVSPGPNLDVYAEPGYCLDLKSALTANDNEWLNTFNGGEGAFSQQTYGDAIDAVPLNIAAACVFYNTEIFSEVGVEVPETYDEFIDACEKIQKAGYTPLSCSAGTAWCLSMIAGYLCDREGADLAAIADGSAKWTDECFVNAANKLLEISKYFQPTAAGDTNDVATAGFYNGEAAMLVQGSWAIGQINGANPDFEDKCGVFSFPDCGVADGSRVIAKSDSLAISAKTEHQDACIALLKYFTDDTAQKYTAEIGGKIPVTTVEYDESVAPAELAYVMDVFGNASGTFGFYNESLASTEAGSFFDDQMVAMYLGTVTVEEALQNVQDFYEENVY